LGRTEDSHRHGDLAHLPPSPASERHAARVGDDRAEPGVEPLRVAQARERPPGAETRLLDRVPRLGLVADDRSGQTQDRVEAVSDQAFERDLIALLGLTTTT
jgi:hypothetical protein